MSFRTFPVAVLVSWMALAPLSFADEGWLQALEPREWVFPRDHGAHPEYRTEWWYFTGNLSGSAGEEYGYQLTFFRFGLRKEPLPAGNPWSLRDVYFAHFALTEGAERRFRHAERASRAGPGLAGADVRGMDVWLLDWAAKMEGTEVRLRARTGEMAIDLELTPRKPVVLHGRGGLSQKGPRPGQASYYASLTDLATRGSIRKSPSDQPVPVEGRSWFDHEFGSNQMAEDQAGWDWFSLHLSSGQDLMVYLLRRKDGSIEPSSSGTLVEPDGSGRHLSLDEIRVETTARWKSPRSGAEYPSRWRLLARGIDVTFDPLAPDQELSTEGSTGLVYWEGAVKGTGMSDGQRVSCRGYVELTGYAGPLGSLF